MKGGSDLQSDPPFPADPLNPVDPVDPIDPVQNSGRLVFAVIYKIVYTFCRKVMIIFGWCPPGAKMAPDRLWS